MKTSSGDFGLELVGVAPDVAVNVMQKAARNVERVRHPEEPTESFGFATRVHRAGDAAFFWVKATDLDAFPDVATKMFRAVMKEVAPVDGATLRWTEHRPPAPEPRLPNDHPIQLPPRWPLPPGGELVETNFAHRGGDKWTYARWDFSFDRAFDLGEYRDTLEAAGWRCSFIDTVQWTVEGHGAKAFLHVGTSGIRIRVEAADNPDWRPFEPAV